MSSLVHPLPRREILAGAGVAALAALWAGFTLDRFPFPLGLIVCLAPGALALVIHRPALLPLFAVALHPWLAAKGVGGSPLINWLLPLGGMALLLTVSAARHRLPERLPGFLGIWFPLMILWVLLSGSVTGAGEAGRLEASRLLMLWFLLLLVWNLCTRRALARALSLLPVGLAVVGGVVLVGIASTGLAEYLFSRALYQERPLGGFGNPNFLGVALAHGLVIVLAMLLRPARVSSPLPRPLLLGLGVVLLASLVLTLSRAAMLYSALAGFALAVTLPRLRGWVLGAAATVFLGVLFLPLPEWLALRLRFHTGTSGRSGLWEGAWNMMRDAPWFGVGPHQFEAVRYSYLDSGTVRFLDGLRGGGAHNAFLHRGAESGIPALLLALGLFLVTLVLAGRALGRHRGDWTVSLAGAAVVGLFVYSQFEVAATVGAAGVSMNFLYFLYALVLLSLDRRWPAERAPD